MTIKGIVFDKDGTLFDFAATWEAWAKAFLHRLSDGDGAMAQRFGLAIGFDVARARFDRDSIAIAGTPTDIAKALLPLLPGREISDVVKMVNEEASCAPQREAVPLMPFLNDLRARGLRLGVATNDAEGPALAHLNAAGVRDQFDFVAGFDSGYGSKPGPGPLLAFAKAMELDPGQIVMVGDSLHDLKAGRAAGMACVGVLTGLADAATLAPLADVVLPNIGHLPGWLDSIN